jgi:hypothetical protein
MNIRQIIFSFSIFLTTVLCGQSTKLKPSFYHIRINVAEMFIVRDKIDSAIRSYQDVLKENGHLRYKDMYNLAVCYSLVHNSKKTVSILKHLVKAGAKVEWFKSNQTLKPILSNKIDKKLRQAEKKYTRKKHALRDLFFNVFKTDQDPRIVPDPYNKNLAAIRKNDSANAKIIDSIIASNSGIIPGEEAVGVTDSSFVWQPHYIFFVHQTLSFGIKNYSEYILNSIKAGTMHPQVGAFLYFHTAGRLLKFGPITLIKMLCFPDSITESQKVDPGYLNKLQDAYPWLVPRMNDSLIASFDSTRAQIGLEPIKDFYRKAIFQNTNKDFKFYQSEFVFSIFQFETKKDLELMKTNYMEL